MSENKWFVYMHVNKINGKRYIGITSRKAPRNRWGKNGNGYLGKRKSGEFQQPHFANAIIKYGWDNFEHIILLKNICEEEAKYSERYLISWYKSNDEKYGYNCTGGGDGRWRGGISDDVEWIRERGRTYYNNNEHVRLQKENYRKQHPEIYRTSAKKYRDKNKNKISEYKKSVQGILNKMEEHWRKMCRIAREENRPLVIRPSAVKKYLRLMKLEEEANNE